MIYDDIRSAIVQSLTDAMPDLLAAWQNVDDTTSIVKEHFAMDSSNIMTLGRDGMSRTKGSYTLTFRYPENTGIGEGLEDADEIITLFKKGKRVEYNGNQVVFQGASVSTPRNQDGWCLVDVKINWLAQYKRV